MRYYPVYYCSPLRAIPLGRVYWRSTSPLFVHRRISNGELSSVTGSYALGVDLIAGVDGQRLGRGLFPQPCLMTKLQALLLRQLTGKTEDNRYMAEFGVISEFFIDRLVDDIRRNMPDDIFKPEKDRECFMSSMPGKSRAFMDKVWQDYESSCAGSTPRRFKKAAQFVKEEDSFKQAGGQTKPRGITVMPAEAYIMLYRMHVVSELVYESPLMKQWMIKHKTTDELWEQLSKIVFQRHRSQDISGFESALGPEIRSVLENQLISRLFRLLGDTQAQRYFNRFASKPRIISDSDFQAEIIIRCSGDFWTSLGNGIANIALVLFGHWMRNREFYSGLDEWWIDASRLNFVTEGDDALIPTNIWQDVATGLRMDYSLANISSGPGGADFLKKVHLPIRDRDMRCFGLINVVRALRGLTYIKLSSTKRNKRNFLLRAKALSLHYLAPGHPIVHAAVRRIGRLTAGARSYSGWERDYNVNSKWLGPIVSAASVCKKFPDSSPTEEMRASLHFSSCAEIPPISVEQQLILEEQLEAWDGQTPVRLTLDCANYGEYMSMSESSADDSCEPMYNGPTHPHNEFLRDGLMHGFDASTPKR